MSLVSRFSACLNIILIFCIQSQPNISIRVEFRITVQPSVRNDAFHYKLW